MKVEGGVEARWACIGKWEIIHAIDKHFELIFKLKNSINYRQTIPSKWNVFSEIQPITEQATTVINLYIFSIENVLHMLFSVFVIIYIMSIFYYKLSSLKIRNKLFILYFI